MVAFVMILCNTEASKTRVFGIDPYSAFQAFSVEVRHAQTTSQLAREVGFLTQCVVLITPLPLPIRWLTRRILRHGWKFASLPSFHPNEPLSLYRVSSVSRQFMEDVELFLSSLQAYNDTGRVFARGTPYV